MLRRKNKTRIKTASLPTELWLIIFDIVIEEGIIRLDDCDHMTFPHVEASFSSSAPRYQFYDSYWRLRLVCRGFNILLSNQPWQFFSGSWSLPFPISTRALYVDHKTLSIQSLSAEMLTFGRIVSLDVEGVALSYFFLQARVGRAFPNVQRLNLKFVNRPYPPLKGSFWTLLHCLFPCLVTLILLGESRIIVQGVQWKEGDKIIRFERLEILYFSDKVPYLACDFPRLRHASIWGCLLSELKILTRSPHLESLLIRSTYIPKHNIDVISCIRKSAQ